MGLGFSKVFVNENDISFYVDSLQKGLSCVEGKQKEARLIKQSIFLLGRSLLRISADCLQIAISRCCVSVL